MDKATIKETPKVARPVTVRVRSSAQVSRIHAAPGHVNQSGACQDDVESSLPEVRWAFRDFDRFAEGGASALTSDNRTFFAIDLRS